MNPLLVAVLVGLFAAATVALEHFAWPDWEPEEPLARPLFYLIGLGTLLSYFWIWALLVGEVPAAASFTVMGGLAGAATLACYTWRGSRRRQEEAGVDAAIAPEGQGGDGRL